MAVDSLLSNGGMEQDGNKDAWPDDWPRLPGHSTWEQEEGNHFIRLKATEPDAMLVLLRRIPVPDGVKAMQLSFRVRCAAILTGKKPFHDGRVIIDFKGASGESVGPPPAAPYFKGTLKEWEEKKVLFAIPEGAAFVDIRPALFQVRSGSFDIDDVVLKAIEPQLVAEAEALAQEKMPPPSPAPEVARPANWPREIRVVGNRLRDPQGREVWLQGVSVPSLEWNPKGDSVLQSIKVAVETWKANVIRLPVNPGYWSGEKGNDPLAYKAMIDAAVNMAANRGAYILIDNHTYRAVKESDVVFWTEVAGRYKNHPAVLFDILNEPFNISWEVWKNGGFVGPDGRGVDESAFLTEEEKKKNRGFQSPGMQKMVEIIRAAGARNVLVAGALDWAYDNSGILKGYALEDKAGNGIMYSAHIYSWKRDWQGKVLDIAAVHPIFVGEVGANNKRMSNIPFDHQEDPATWVPDILGAIQKYRLNWTGWCFHPSASPVMLQDWKFTPNPEWGVPAKEALAGKQFELKKLR